MVLAQGVPWHIASMLANFISKCSLQIQAPYQDPISITNGCIGMTVQVWHY